MAARPRSLPPSTSTSAIPAHCTRSHDKTDRTPPADAIIATRTTTNQTTQDHDATTIPPHHPSRPQPSSSSSITGIRPPPSRLAAQAEALAKMTLEINLRSVSRQAERLERELRALVRSTAGDQAFRERHEARLQDTWREILAVKAHMARDRDTKHLADEACRRETQRAVDEMREEIAGVRRMVGDISSTISEMPSAEQMQAALSQGSEADSVGRKEERNTQTQQRLQSPPSSCENPTVQRRIQETIRSTRRWNREHKTTSDPDAVFCTRYLKQQSKRDATMAVFLQRAIQRRVQARFPGRRLRPRSLDDLCRVVEWGDVKSVVEDVLMRDTSDVVEALRK